jgi:voltage-gated potassium channel
MTLAGGLPGAGANRRSMDHERVQKRLEPILLVATLLVLPVLILQASRVDEPWRTLAHIGDWAIWLVFTFEVVLMLAITPDRWRWLKQHPLDVAIVVLTPPFAASLLSSVRALRLLRLVRLLRLANLARSVFSLDGVRYAGFLAALTAVAGAEAFRAVEGISSDEALYWSFSTITTVGYGDVTPQTDEGRMIAVAVMLVGIGFAAVLTGAIAQRFIATEDPEDDLRERLAEIAERLERLERRD